MKQVLKKATAITIVAVFAMTLLAGCFTNEHIVGTGAATGYTESAKQWYLIYGLLALNNVDTKAMSGAAQNYKIITQTSVVDALISSLTVGLLVPRTVKVIK
jgi:Bor protein